LRLDTDGWRVFAGVRSGEDAEALRQAGSERLVPLMLDVTDSEQIAAAAERIGGEVGGTGLEGLVNNAGIAIGGAIEALSIDRLRHQLEVNVIGQVAVTQALLPMIRAVPGRVVFVGSINGRMSTPFLSPYAASKHAIEAIGDSLRGEMRPFGVEVSIVEPGAIATPIWEKSGETTREVKAAMSEEQLQLYGKAIDGFVAAAQRGGARGASAERVAGAVSHALTARRPRTRYLVGADAHLQALLRWLVPDRVGDRLIARAIRG
jgi:NAD(P)-dependent dehydrogenase (short-subunit alcohol dehydrogenase family)